MIIQSKYSLVLGILLMLSIVGCGDSAGLFTSTDNDTISKADNVEKTTVTGNVGKGKAVSGSVKAYKDDGTLLGTGIITTDGTFSMPSGDYTGKVRVVATITEYIDENLNKSTAVSDLELSALSSISSDARVLNITALTEIASRILGVGALTNPDISSQKIDDMNIYVAKASGVTDDYNPAKGSVVYLNKNAGEQEDTPLNRNAIVLLSISKDSALQEGNDTPKEVLTKVNAAVDRFYHAILSSADDRRWLESIVENLSTTGVSIQNIDYAKIITSKNDVPDVYAAKVNALQKIIAYSTCSQLGYMFFAAGIGAYNVAIFHLFTHAFFKALLFLGSGSVIHSFKDEQDIRNMGGVLKKMQYTWILMKDKKNSKNLRTKQDCADLKIILLQK